MSDDKKVDLRLSRTPDEFEFLYGHLSHDGETYNVNVMPPKGEWKGGQQLNGYEPHDRDWVVYLDGEEFARVRKQGDIIRRLQIKLLA